MTKAIVLYMPVIHRGYTDFLQRNQPADIVLLTANGCKGIDKAIADQLSRDIRSIPAEEVGAYLHAKFPGLRIRIIDDFEGSKSFLNQFSSLVMPDEDISHSLEKLVPLATIEYDPAFLRWDWRNTTFPKEVLSDHPVSVNELDRHMLLEAQKIAIKSSDFWRQVGAVVQTGSGLLLAFNKHMPTEMEPYINGDMRLIMKPGESPEVCSALHAERGIITQAAKKGISLEGKNMYVTTFPCLGCAQMIAATGVKKLFFKEGYSNQNATEVLKAAEVEIIRVQ
ncbi:MAG TPA: deaminase [Candidatus Paceibacterota bacterium]|nr:deaminase [Candidatus Paceibacterota bacterium]